MSGQGVKVGCGFMHRNVGHDEQNVFKTSKKLLQTFAQSCGPKCRWFNFSLANIFLTNHFFGIMWVYTHHIFTWAFQWYASTLLKMFSRSYLKNLGCENFHWPGLIYAWIKFIFFNIFMEVMDSKFKCKREKNCCKSVDWRAGHDSQTSVFQWHPQGWSIFFKLLFW